MSPSSQESFKPDTTTCESPKGGRGLDFYEEYLFLSRHNISGHTILDLGSGSRERLSRHLARLGIKAKVISLNPDYLFKHWRLHVINLPDWQKMSVAGIAERLPFKDQAFDLVLALYSLMPHSKDINGKIWAQEISRVLKPGGVAKIAPVKKMRSKALILSDEERYAPEIPCMEELRKNGMEVSIKFVESIKVWTIIAVKK